MDSWRSKSLRWPRHKKHLTHFRLMILVMTRRFLNRMHILGLDTTNMNIDTVLGNPISKNQGQKCFQQLLKLHSMLSWITLPQRFQEMSSESFSLPPFLTNQFSELPQQGSHPKTKTIQNRNSFQDQVTTMVSAQVTSTQVRKTRTTSQ